LESITHSLFGGHATPVQKHGLYDIEVRSIDEKRKIRISVLDQPSICGTIPCVDGQWRKELENAGIQLSDVGRKVHDVHLLIGADVLGKLLTGKIFPTSDGPVAQETKLGWVVMGKVETRPQAGMSNGDNNLVSINLHVQDATVQDLWKLDVLGITDPAEVKSRQEIMESAARHFNDTVKVLADGRYEVSLPWIEGHPPVADNKDVSVKRLQSATKKLHENGCQDQYQNVFDSWEEDGIVEKVPEEEKVNGESYLPHRPVFNPKSTTTPIRPVFDASAKSKGRPSLNDCLEKGPNLIELIPTILTRFRVKEYGVVSDVKKAFLQISVKKEDRDFLRFLWWEKGSEEIQEYRHCRVVFGVSSSPFLLAATVNYHLDHAPEEFDGTSQLLKKSLYVDNCVVSLETEEEVKRFIRESTLMMSQAQMDLRGWVWRSPQLDLEKSELVSVLGLLWNLAEDTLGLDLREFKTEKEEKATKRMILSAAHRVFDPIGFTSPATLLPKMMLQEVWALKKPWDEEVPVEIKRKYASWLNQVNDLGKVQIPRKFLKKRYQEEALSLHTFSDASLKAYAGCVFLRGEDAEGVEVQLVMSKSRVAPMKKVTIPRLELLGCCIGTRLAVSAKEMLEMPNIRCYYWTDSSNALYWIRKNENWATFVYNRVQEIRKLSNPEDWRHISGDHNPADLPSRGCSPKKLVGSNWWKGPDWLRSRENHWPTSDIQPDMLVVMAEKKKNVVSHLSTENDAPWYAGRFSSFRKCVRTLAWMKRWKVSSEKSDTTMGELVYEEEEAAELLLLKLIQVDNFKVGDPVLKQLNAVKDTVGVWRIRTKILMRDDLDDFRCPILLPPDDDMVKLLIQDVHRRNNHCGTQVLMTMLREKFWIPKCRRVVKHVIHSCGRCRRFVKKNLNAVEAPLPEVRVRESTPFEVVGVDLGGPLYLKEKQKSWFVIFTCAVFRAIHLELLTSLSTEAFLQALRRFIARRGRPYMIISDNGTNFEGASNAIEKLDWEKIAEFSTAQKIRWSFNPPSAPWWGGFWERMVGMVKVLLRRVLGRASLSYEELQTVLCDCEGVINSRPLCYVSEDVEDLIPLTPAMFLHETRSWEVPDLDHLESHGFGRRYAYRQKLRDDLRSRFRKEYLGALSYRGVKRNQFVKVGDVVLIGSDNTRRLDWPLARILECIPGRDGIVRVVKMKTATGEFTRPIQRIYPLEASGKDELETRTTEEVPGSSEGTESFKIDKYIPEGKLIKTKSGRTLKTLNRRGVP
jgi:hypothetical protein